MPNQSRKISNQKTPEGVHQNLECVGEYLLDHIFGKATMTLLQQGKPVTVETLRNYLKQETEYQKHLYLPAHEFLDSLENNATEREQPE